MRAFISRRPRATIAIIAATVAGLFVAGSLIVPVLSARARLNQLRAQAVLRVGIDPSVEPFTFYGGDAGSWSGLDADVALAIAQALSTTLQPVPVGFDGRYDALETGIVDVVISAVSIDPAQTQRVAHSRAYFDAGPRLIAGAGRAEALDGARVAVALGGEGDRAARFLERRTSALRRLTAPSDAEAWARFQRGESDAVVLDGVEAVRLGCPPLGDGDLRASSIYVCRAIAPNPYVVLTRASDASLAKFVDDTLAQLVQTGRLNALAAQWVR